MKVGLIYDPIYLEHDTGQHVENRHRLEQTVAVLEQSQLLPELVSLSPRAASMDELLLVHGQEHILRVENVCQKGGGWLDADTVTSSASYEAALYAAGGVLRGVDAVMAGEVNSAFALVRPPGHHATYLRAMGFCLFNNIAIAARYALKNHGLQRILIADFDVHHGNGTQETFYSDPQVLYFSTHQYPFYPGTGAIDEIGHGAGRGMTVNCPLPAWCGNAEYLRLFNQVLVPVARRFQPELIMVSAGYDSHWADPIALMEVDADGFAEMVTILSQLAQELCDGRLLFTLEGGYHLEALAYSIKATLEILLGRPRTEEPLGKASGRRNPASIDSIVDAIKRVHGLS
jgi:acetoin utilization deacetylase AcuC-like enzyme